jgi:hypothetical protein
MHTATSVDSIQSYPTDIHNLIPNPMIEDSTLPKLGLIVFVFIARHLGRNLPKLGLIVILFLAKELGSNYRK